VIGLSRGGDADEITVMLLRFSLSSQRMLGPSVLTAVDTTLGPDFRQDDGNTGLAP